jgi:hypothetical protein
VSFRKRCSGFQQRQGGGQAVGFAGRLVVAPAGDAGEAHGDAAPVLALNFSRPVLSNLWETGG